MCCEHSILKIYLCKRQLTIRVEVIIINANNLKIANKIVTTIKAK